MVDDPPAASSAGLQGMRFAVRLEIDGRTLDLKPFLHDLLGGAVTGMVEGLRDVALPQSVKIEVRRLEP